MVSDREELARSVLVATLSVRLTVTVIAAPEKLMCVEGHTNKGISERLDILPDTAKKHRANVLQKMETPQLSDLLALCKGLDPKVLEP